MRRLTDKQRKFVELKAKGLNATQSAMQAYDVKNYNTARAIGSENLAKPAIRDALAPLLEKHELTIDKALAPLKKAIEAKKIVEVEGDFIETEVDDLDMQLKASDRILKLHGINKTEVNSLHLHLSKITKQYDL